MIERIPPHSQEAEAGAIGCALLDPGLSAELQAQWFFDVRHQEIMSALHAMLSDGAPISQTTLIQKLADTGRTDTAGGLQYVLELPNQTPSALNFGYWADILREKALLRAGIAEASEFITRAYGQPEDITGLLNEHESSVLSLRRNGSGNDQTIKQLMIECSYEFDECARHQGKLRGLSTGFSDLDKKTNGLRPGQLIIVAARPGLGKTSLLMNIAEHVSVDSRQPVGVITLEMSAKELSFRMVCSRARVSQSAATAGAFVGADVEKITNASTAIARAPLHIAYGSAMTITQLHGKARRMASQHGLKLLCLDYLQLLHGTNRKASRYEQVTEISNGLKAIATALEIPVICAAQLNRDSENKGKPRKPTLADLRDSGAIEQDADICGFLYRDPKDEAGFTVPYELIIAKHRNGPTGKIDLVFLPEITRFESASKIDRDA